MKESYCICGQLVATDIERNEHILSHFEQKQCNSCDNRLIFVAGRWYQPHNDPNCNEIKEEPGNDYDIGLSPLYGISDTQIAVDSISEIVPLGASKQECLTDELEHNEEIIAEPCLTYADQSITDPESLYKCENCPKQYHLKSSLIRHKRTCMKLHLKKRKKRKTSESDEYDEIAEKNQGDNISTHSSESNQENESELKPFPCLFCTERFLYRGTANRHMRRFHQKTDVLQKSGVVEQTNIDASRALPHSSEEHPEENKIYIACYVCERQFQNPTMFAKHLKTHPNAEFKCSFSECNEQFDSVDLLVFHLTNHMQVQCKLCSKSYVNHPNAVHKCKTESDEEFICDYCNKTFFKKDNLRRHIFIHLTHSPYKCNICEKGFRTVPGLREHRYTHNVRRPYTCTIVGCGRVFTLRRSMYKHRSKVHDEFKKQYPCPKCNKILSEKGSLRKHLLRHEATPWKFENGPNKTSCPLCSIVVLRRSLQEHLNRKHGIAQKTFVCYVCHEKITTPKQMVNHLQTHPKAELKCCYGDCDERFDSVDTMHRHFISHLQIQCEICKKNYTHYHKCELPDALGKYICDLCGKAFKDKHRFKQHMDIHMDRRPFSCDICGKAFRRAAAVTRHRHSHTGTKPLKCDFENCGRAFIQHTDLHRHRFKAHGIFRKKFPCTICNQVFPENAFLRKHMANHEV